MQSSCIADEKVKFSSHIPRGVSNFLKNVACIIQPEVYFRLKVKQVQDVSSLNTYPSETSLNGMHRVGSLLAVLWETESCYFQGQCTHFVPEMMNAVFGFMLTAMQQHLLVSTV